MWKEEVWPNLRYYPGKYQEKRSSIRKHQHRSISQELNKRHLPNTSTTSVNLFGKIASLLSLMLFSSTKTSLEKATTNSAMTQAVSRGPVTAED